MNIMRLDQSAIIMSSHHPAAGKTSRRGGGTRSIIWGTRFCSSQESCPKHGARSIERGTCSPACLVEFPVGNSALHHPITFPLVIDPIPRLMGEQSTTLFGGTSSTEHLKNKIITASFFKHISASFGSKGS
ncbi:hypothetical protein Sjap_022431 [Stephania japonica]|uniref:Uncharacterized protein n=1 Tax=Stephania japonica TaxID=461633 RepID=A0AAP0EPB6_9MAGN